MSKNAAPPAAAQNVQDTMKRMWTENMKNLEIFLEGYPFVVTVSQKTGVSKSHLVVGVLGALSLYIWIGFGGNPVANLVGFVWPVYASFKALKSAETEDDTQWLTYWIVFGIVSTIESFTDFLLQTLPFYFIWKIAFFVWLFMPQTKGAQVLYVKVIEPILNKYEVGIDAQLNRGVLLAKKAGGELASDPNVLRMAAQGAAVASQYQ